ncbi:hypothetical protein K0M31_011507 [Melipona bicolor]|uniref:Uncharacterized protein n=1 Tax=Melipona bicolor TaxID=60889 RepID=A0AA40G9M7_9HYME|nr:hypothetical protein K0M31_011507 [Melipona bicolor]
MKDSNKIIPKNSDYTNIKKKQLGKFLNTSTVKLKDNHHSTVKQTTDDRRQKYPTNIKIFEYSIFLRFPPFRSTQRRWLVARATDQGQKQQKGEKRERRG